MEHDMVSDSISAFLSAYAARTGTHNAVSASDDPSASSSGSTGGVVAAQLTRLMNGLAGRIDYDAFTNLISGLNSNNTAPSSPTTTTAAAAADTDISMAVDEDDDDPALLETPAGLVEPPTTANDNGDGEGKESFSKSDELAQAATPTVDDSLRDDSASPSKKSKKDKKDKKDKKEKKSKKVKDEA